MTGVRKILAVILAAVMALCCMPVGAEEAAPTTEPVLIDKDTLIVGSTTAMSGNFFSEMFGNNTSDIDARALLHGYNLMEWNSAFGAYGINRSVVSGFIATDDAAGNRTYTVSIYNDLTYSDGTPITAADYAFSMLLSVSPAMRAIGADTVESDYIVGIDAYKAGETDVLTGMRILSPTQMSITVKAEYRPFFYELALLDYNPYPIHVIAPGCEVVDNGEGVMIRNADQSVTEPIFSAQLLEKTILDPATGYLNHPEVVSGPYTLLSYNPKTHTANFVANPAYKGNSNGVKATIPNIVFRPVSPDTMMEELAEGKVDLINKTVSEQNIMDGLALTGEGGVASINYPRSGYSFISFNCEKPATGSLSVRKALATALDKAALTTDYVGNYGLTVDGYYGIGQWMYQIISGAVAAPLGAPDDENATEAEIQAYEEEQQEAWDALNLDGLTRYGFDLAAAENILVEDGWMLNQNGGDYEAGQDQVRCKVIDGALTALDLKLIYPEGNTIAPALQSAFADNLAQIGVKVTLEARPMTDLLDVYYRNVDRDCDMIYLATNFATVFDPSYTFSPADAYQGKSNRTAIMDEELYNRAVAMRQTEPEDTLGYCQKWVSFQERWTEVLPTIPVYSNVYFDFYTNILQNYNVNASLTWSQAILGAYFGMPAEEEEEDFFEDEGEFTDEGGDFFE